jgi:tungstate transport system ATP-binding protein
VLYQVEGLQQTYSGRTVLNIERLEVYPGEVLAVVGPSGAGKSTLLRLLNFLEMPTAGTIMYCGKPVNGHTSLEIRRQVTMVFQRPVLLRTSVYANVAYGLHLRGNRADEPVKAMLQRVGLMHLARQPAATLSGGEAQRVALARALVIQPKVLLLDEPTANLDPYNAKLIEDLIVEVNQQRQTTIVLVTHNIFQARRLAHRVGFLLDGSLIEVAPTQAFFHSPQDPRTQAFVRGDTVY